MQSTPSGLAETANALLLLRLWQGNNTDQMDEDLDDLLGISKLGVLAEAALEAAHYLGIPEKARKN